MSAFDPRYIEPCSTGELDRRHRTVRAAMEREGFDALLLYNYDNFLGGYTRYLTDNPVAEYPTCVVFYREDDLSYIVHGAPDVPSRPDYCMRRVTAPLGLPFMTTLHYTDSLIPQLVCEDLRRHGVKRLGLIARQMLPVSLVEGIRAALPAVEQLDATDLLDRIKAVKSEEEIAGLRKIAHTHDILGAAVPSVFRPGRTDYEIQCDLKHIAAELGCYGLNIQLGSDPIHPKMNPPGMYGRRVEDGDCIFILLEVSGPGGLYGEIARVWSLGRLDEALVRAVDSCFAAQDWIAAQVRPGADPAELYRLNNEFLAERGYGAEKRLFAHGQGYDMVERPAFVPAERMKLEENMFLAIHPGASNGVFAVNGCDNYLVTATGCERLTHLHRGVILV